MQRADDSDHTANEAANQRALTRFAWIFGACLALALAVPAPFFALAICACSGLAAGGAATVALLARQDVFVPHLSLWDVAALLYAISLLAGFFIDPGGVRLHFPPHEGALWPP